MPNVGQSVGHPAHMLLDNQPDDSLVLPMSMVGVEVEALHVLEYRSPRVMTVSEGSLRGMGRELIFTQPMFGVDVIKALDEMQDILQPIVELYGEEDVFNVNTSAHVHIDVRDMDYDHLASFIQYWVMFEKAVFTAYSPNRWDNNFCVPMSKGHESLRQAQSLYRSLIEGYSHLDLEPGNRYCAMNLSSILEHGSVEFRIFNGTYKKEVLLKYINLLLSIKKKAMEEGDNSLRPYINLKGRALQPVIDEIFPPEIAADLAYRGIYHDLKDGINNARFIANVMEFDRANDLCIRQARASQLGEVEEETWPRSIVEEALAASRPVSFFTEEEIRDYFEEGE